MIRVGIVGATGYAGEELIKILLKHPHASIVYLAAKIEEPLPISDIFGYLANRLELYCELLDYKKIVSNCQVVFLALPHTASMEIVPSILSLDSKIKIIDLSADYRLKNTTNYSKYYKVKHKSPELIKEAIYGLPEFYREKIKESRLVANPGCYPTLALLSIVPLIVAGLIEFDPIIIDAKSGFTGAGRKADIASIFSEVNENVKPYKINIHQHMPEIEQELEKFSGKKIKINFIPQLLPLNRGIIQTIYVRKKRTIKTKDLIQIYRRFYRKEPFVRVYAENKFPQLKNVVNTNFCDIGFYNDLYSKTLIVVSALDNLLKGASGQAVQNMNIMYGFEETLALL